MSEAVHWEGIHSSRDMNTVSWWQEAHQVWADLIVDLHMVPEAPIVDIGAGSSMMVDALLAHGFTNLTAMDISTAALARTRRRVGTAVDLVVADVRYYVTDVPVALWHDRAVFHFLVEEADRTKYRHNLHESLAAGGHAVIATFAPDGPQMCSGLPAQRYSAEELADVLDLRLEKSEQREHVTPSGKTQPFTIAVLAH